MLDDLKYIHQKDVSDGLGIVAKQAEQLGYEFTPSAGASFKTIQNVVYGAMGGSALAAQLLESWPALEVPFQIVRDYELPAYVSEHTLFIAASYSGSTEETLTALAEAERKGAQIAVITNGGKLRQIAEEKGYVCMQLPKLVQPRYAVLYNCRALLDILTIAGLVDNKEVEEALGKAVKLVENSVAAWLPTVPTAKNPAKQLAQELLGKSVVVYAGPKLFPAAYKLKININENAKHVAWTGRSPEFYHNEFMGWTVAPPQKPYAVVEFRSPLEHPRIQKRFEVGARLLSGMRPQPIVIEPQGETVLEQLLWLAAFSDFVSIYLGILNGVDPTPVELVEKFKKELDT